MLQATCLKPKNQTRCWGDVTYGRRKNMRVVLVALSHIAENLIGWRGTDLEQGSWRGWMHSLLRQSVRSKIEDLYYARY